MNRVAIKLQLHRLLNRRFFKDFWEVIEREGKGKGYMSNMFQGNGAIHFLGGTLLPVETSG